MAQPKGGFHWFDGDGMLHACRITPDGTVSYANHLIQTNRLALERAAKHQMVMRLGDLRGWGGLGQLLLEVVSRKAGVIDAEDRFQPANTSVVAHGDKLLALHEQDFPYSLQLQDDGTLRTMQRHNFGGQLRHTFTAHPKLDPATGEMLFFGVDPGSLPPKVHLSIADAHNDITTTLHIPLERPCFMHDFAITQKHVILLDSSLVVAPQVLLQGGNRMPMMLDLRKPMRVGLLPRKEPSAAALRWFDLPPCMVFHTGNAWEEADGTVRLWVCVADQHVLKAFLDENILVKLPKPHGSGSAAAVRHGEASSSDTATGKAPVASNVVPFERPARRLGFKQPKAKLPTVRELDHDIEQGRATGPGLPSGLYEFTMDPATGTASHRLVVEGPADFPVINPSYISRRSQYLYFAMFDISGSMAAVSVSKVDTLAGRQQPGVVGSIHYATGCYGGEALFVPRDNDPAKCDGEDDGWLMLFLFHEVDQHSELVVYDAKTMSSEPLATVRMPQRVPYGFHSHFISEDRLKALVKVAAMEAAGAKQRASGTA